MERTSKKTLDTKFFFEFAIQPASIATVNLFRVRKKNKSVCDEILKTTENKLRQILREIQIAWNATKDQ